VSRLWVHVAHQQVDVAGLHSGEALSSGEGNEVDCFGIAEDRSGNNAAHVSVEADHAAVGIRNRERNGCAGDAAVERATSDDLVEQ